MVNANDASQNAGFIAGIVQKALGVVDYILNQINRPADLKGKLVLFDNDELLLVWEHNLREVRIKKEEEAWKKFEKEFGRGSPKVTDAFIKWQEQLYAYIEQEKDRFLRERPGVRAALAGLLRSGAKTIVVTKGAKPYTEKCFNLLGLSPYVSDIYSPAPGKRDKRFADSVRDNGKRSTMECLRDTLIVGHDAEKDMGWDMVPPKSPTNDGNAPVLVLFDALDFERDVEAPLDALLEIIELLAKRGKNNLWQGFRSITKPAQAKTRNYTFSIALYSSPKRSDKAKVPVIHNIKRR